MKATSGGAEEARSTTEPVRRAPSAQPPVEVGEGLAMILVPQACWDAARALGKRLGAATGGEALHPAAVVGLALKRLQEDTDRRLGPERKG